jgi:hypothetical protein
MKLNTQEPDDGARGETGLAVSIVERADGKAGVVFDDIKREGSEAPFHWSTEWFFTRIEFDLTDLVECQLEQEDFAIIGQAVVARLAAHHKTRSLPTAPIVSPFQERVMGPFRYSINVTLDGCCDHRAMVGDEDLHRHAAENLVQADALLFGRVT